MECWISTCEGYRWSAGFPATSFKSQGIHMRRSMFFSCASFWARLPHLYPTISSPCSCFASWRELVEVCAQPELSVLRSVVGPDLPKRGRETDELPSGRVGRGTIGIHGTSRCPLPLVISPRKASGPHQIDSLENETSLWTVCRARLASGELAVST